MDKLRSMPIRPESLVTKLTDVLDAIDNVAQTTRAEQARCVDGIEHIKNAGRENHRADIAASGSRPSADEVP